jgi:hypothetical protein
MLAPYKTFGAVSEFWRFPLGDELVVARRDIQGLFLMNSSARLLWESWTAGAPVEQVVQEFAAVFGLPRRRARQDIEAILANWSENLLASERPAARPSAQCLSVLRSFALNSSVVSIDCSLNGHAFRVQLEPGDLVEEIVPRLAHSVVPRLPSDAHFSSFILANGKDRVFVFRDGMCIAEEKKTAGARVILLQEITRLCSPGRELTAILHAGACGTNSACVVLAGASHAGKSTLCAALMAEGLYCYSDDSAVIDHNCNVAGMPFPLMLRLSSWPVLASRSASFELAPVQRRGGTDVRLLPSNLPANSSPSLPANALVFVDYQPGARTSLQPLTAFEALLEVQKSGFWVKHDRESIARFLAWIGRLHRYRLTYPRIDDAIDTLGAFLD